MIRFFFYFMTLSGAIQETVWKWWYQWLAAYFNRRDWRFMNYGFIPNSRESPPLLKNEDEANRLFIQLYHHTLSELEIKGKNVLEIGSGRGGGTEYVARYFNPQSIIGLDFSKNAVALCNQFYHLPMLKFIEGNAENLPFDDKSFDLILNIESSHCYGNMRAFISEVSRVLKPGGFFAWSDLRTEKLMEREEEIFMHSSLRLIRKENITNNVLLALDQTSDLKVDEIKKSVPRVLQKLFFEFTAIHNSKIYKRFKEGSMVYSHYLFQKPF